MRKKTSQRNNQKMFAPTSAGLGLQGSGLDFLSSKGGWGWVATQVTRGGVGLGPPPPPMPPWTPLSAPKDRSRGMKDSGPPCADSLPPGDCSTGWRRGHAGPQGAQITSLTPTGPLSSRPGSGWGSSQGLASPARLHSWAVGNECFLGVSANPEAPAGSAPFPPAGLDLGRAIDLRDGGPRAAPWPGEQLWVRL